LLKPQRALDSILREALQQTGATGGSFILINPNTGVLDIEASVGLSQKARRLKLRPGEGITGWVAITGRPLRVNDVSQEVKYVTANPRVRAEMAVPVSLGQHVVGVLNVDSPAVHAFTAEHEARLVAFAAEAAAWLQSVWEIDQLRIKERQLAALVGMVQLIHTESNSAGGLERIARAANRLMRTKLCSLLLVSDDLTELALAACDGGSDRYRNRPPLPVADSLVGVVVTRRKPLAVLNVQENQKFRHLEVAKQEGLVSLLAVPLVSGDRLLGVLAVYTRAIHRFSNDEIRLLKTLADLSAIAIEKDRLWERAVDKEETLRVSERLSALGLLAAEVAHEIRNPLTVMQMLFHSLVESAPLDETHRRDAVVIAEKMRQMNRIVDQILGFARSSEPSRDFLDLEQLVADIVLLIRHKLKQQGIDIRTTVARATPPLYADRQQVEQALLNLVLNAADAMPQGGTLRLTAGVESFEGATWSVLIVRDTGKGMTPRQQDELFAPFLTHKKGGTGIGLAIVRKIVENHQGKIRVDSRPNRGTVFRLYFPIMP
jgi:signal transduction histidine kinase